jgi:hypothetical protein
MPSSPWRPGIVRFDASAEKLARLAADLVVGISDTVPAAKEPRSKQSAVGHRSPARKFIDNIGTRSWSRVRTYSGARIRWLGGSTQF